jgi:Transposase
MKWKKNGWTTAQKRQGKPKKINNIELHQVINIIEKNRRATAEEIACKFSALIGKTVSIRSIRRYLKELGYRGCAGVRKPLISEKNREIRLQWANDHENWTMDQWMDVIWSDESKFELFSVHGRQWVWRKPDEKYKIDCLIPTVKSGGLGVMVWACFSGRGGLGPLVELRGRINAAKYKNLLEQNLLPFIKEHENRYVFQDDNAPIHTAKLIKKWMEETGIVHMKWPRYESN